MSCQFEYLEDYLQRKKSSNLNFHFKSETIKIVTINNSYRGLFAAKSFKQKETIYATDAIGGSYGFLDAVEDAHPLIQKMGPSKSIFYSENPLLLLALGLYCRSLLNKNFLVDDLFFSDLDVKSFYQHDPARLIFSHYPEDFMQSLVSDGDFERKILQNFGIDMEYYESMCAFVATRNFAQKGIVPIFDLMNASSAYEANIYVDFGKDQYSIVALTDIQENEELRWAYVTDIDAERFFFKYGFLPKNRHQVCTLSVILSKKGETNVHQLLDQFTAIKSRLSDVCQFKADTFKFKLPWPGPELSTLSIWGIEVSECTKKWCTIQDMFKLLLIESEEDDNIRKNLRFLSLEPTLKNTSTIMLEIECIDFFLNAIDKGQNLFDLSVTNFNNDEKYNMIDLKPLIEMQKGISKKTQDFLKCYMTILKEVEKTGELSAPISTYLPYKSDCFEFELKINDLISKKSCIYKDLVNHCLTIPISVEG